MDTLLTFNLIALILVAIHQAHIKLSIQKMNSNPKPKSDFKLDNISEYGNSGGTYS